MLDQAAYHLHVHISVTLNRLLFLKKRSSRPTREADPHGKEPIDLKLPVASDCVAMPVKTEPYRCPYCHTTEKPIFVRLHRECPNCHTTTQSSRAVDFALISIFVWVVIKIVGDQLFDR